MSADPGQVAATAAATNAFGVDLYRALTAGGGARGNLVLSPSGLATVLAMALPGARGATADELSKALHTGLTATQYAVATGALDRQSRPADGKDAAVLRRSDTLWAQQGLTLDPGYLATLAAAFDTGVRTTDFRTDPAGSRQAVNALVEKDTEGRIKDLFGPRDITPDTRLVLTDALYLKAKWREPFQHSRTSDQPFHRLDGNAAAVSTMGRNGVLRYAEGSGGIAGQPWQAVELPYAGGNLAMDVVVPAQGGFEGFVHGLDAAQLDRILGGLAERQVDLTLPRFTFETSNNLVGPLRALGVNTAFDAADLGGIPGPGEQERLKVDAVVQKATIAVDEDGTVAAAGSGVGIGAAAAAIPTPAVELHVDRPFVFLIRDTVTGQPLFLGQVADPSPTS
ncbi:serpin family protein [Kitasatospora herbaricolor]|uniref:Serpin family protein n=1 Tax=Kitasatospora herbaricolor TaxID=68217 RepID=A0ABZ1WBQ6_9ACTN|nr:serpin family protein [Kitasatospora herbaricolor]